MARKLIAGGLVVAALLAGLGGVTAFVLASDHTAKVPAAGRPAGNPANAGVDANGASVDLNNWQEARVTIPGSKFK